MSSLINRLWSEALAVRSSVCFLAFGDQIFCCLACGFPPPFFSNFEDMTGAIHCFRQHYLKFVLSPALFLRFTLLFGKFEVRLAACLYLLARRCTFQFVSGSLRGPAFLFCRDACP